jgi:hypothetical protein
MLTGPVYQSILVECAWLDALNRRDTIAADKIMGQTFVQIDASGASHDRKSLLANIASGASAPIAMSVNDVTVPFSAGSSNILISTWTFHKSKHRVTDVFFCNVFSMCTYRLVAEQITKVRR